MRPLPLLADKLVDTDSDGKVFDKARLLADAKSTEYSSAEYYDPKVPYLGIPQLPRAVSDASGKPFDSNVRWTDTWTKMPNGKWQCIATQATPAT